MITLNARAICKEVKKKSRAKGFEHLEVGDVMKFSVPIAHVGSNGYNCRTYAVYIKFENERTGDKGKRSFNQLQETLNCFEFEQVGE